MSDHRGVSMSAQWRRQTHHAAESRLESLNRANSRSYDDILAPRLNLSRKISGGGEDGEGEEEDAPHDRRSGPAGGGRKAALRRSMSADTPFTHRRTSSNIIRPFREPQQEFAEEQLEPRAFSPEKLRRAMCSASSRRRQNDSWGIAHSGGRAPQGRFGTPALPGIGSTIPRSAKPEHVAAGRGSSTRSQEPRHFHSENGDVDVLLLLDGTTTLEATPVTVEHNESSEDESGGEGSDDDEYIDLTGSAASDARKASENVRAVSPNSGRRAGGRLGMAVDHEKYAMFRVTSIRDRDTVQQLMHIDEADPLRRGRPGQPSTPALPNLRAGFGADQVVTRDAIEKKRRQERMWRSVKNKIKASAYRMGVLDFWGRFTAADTDNDGGLNYREFSHLCKLQVEGISDDEIRLVLSQVDRDRSGFVDYTEFLRFLIERVRIKLQLREQRFVESRKPTKIMQSTPELLDRNPSQVKSAGDSEFTRVVYEEATASSIARAVARRNLHDVSQRQAHFRVWMRRHSTSNAPLQQ